MPYVYAVTESACAPRAPHVVRWGELAAIVGAKPLPGEPDERSFWHHEQVVEAAMARGPVLPMRFGSVVDDITGFLAARHDEFAAALDRVRGAVELGVRVIVPEVESEPTSGTEYLMRRATSSALAERVHAPLAELSRASVGRFCECVTSLADRVETDLVCTGPWPPYSFVEPA
jgi:hypothetical protein